MTREIIARFIIGGAGILISLVVLFGVVPLWCMLKRFWGWRRYRG
jgi:hypothetical protein